jgi:exonuclease SbcC
MIIREVELKNIRSHSDSLIKLKDGINLILGDIGAGKSSILYAIEFALFGTGSRFGRNKVELLRNGERSGWVEVKFENRDKEYLFHREIKDESDKGGWVIEDGVKTNLSARELRQNALNVLGLKESKSTNSKSYIYEYAVFTPQEEMKKILEDKPEDRMKLLRKAFGLTDYANARDNAEIIKKSFGNEIKSLKAQTEDMPEKIEERSRILKELELLRENEKMISAEIYGLRRAEEELKKKIAECERRDEEREEIAKKLNGVRNEIGYLHSELNRVESELVRIGELKTRLPSLEKDYLRYNELESTINSEYSKREERKRYEFIVKDRRSRIDSLKKEIDEIRREISREGEIAEHIKALESEIERSDVEERSKKNFERKTSVKKDIESLDNELKALRDEEKGYRELSGQKYCPKCGQPLTEEHVRRLISETEEEIERKEAERKELLEIERELELEEKSIIESRKRVEALNRELQSALRESDRIEERRRELSVKEEEMRREEEEYSSACAKRDSVVVGNISTLEAERNGLKRRYEEHVRAKGEIEREQELKDERDSKSERVEKLAAEEKALMEKAESLEPVKDELKRLRNEENELVGELSAKEEKLKNTGELIRRQDEEIKKVDDEIEKLERKEERRKKLEIAAEYLTNFAEKMEIIEKNLVNFLNQEFQAKFQELFSMLIDNEITVDVDESFTPVIKENGMDINLSSLSGGERTSVAMAYRLALNRTVQMESTGMEESTIILDEPTDGFSAEQIGQFGELLRVIGCKQVILVSHEQELESCADHMLRVEKENGTSRVM